MAETFRQAAIGTDISVDGLDKIFQANDYVDKLIGKMKTLTGMNKDVGSSMDKINNGNSGLKEMNQNAQNATNSYRFMSNEVNKAKATVENMKQTISGQNSEIQQMKQRIDELRQNNPVLQSIRDNFKNNNSAIKENIDNVKKLQGSLGQIHDDNIKRLGQSGEETGRKFDESEKKLHRFRDTALGTFAGNIFANTFGSIPNVLKDATEQGLKFSSAGADVKKNWANAGLNPAQTDGMIKQLGEIRQHADISAGAITGMQRKYLGLTNGNVGQAQAITNTMTSFGKDSQMTGRQSKMMDRMMSSNQKVNAGMFNKTALGPLRNEIEKMSGMTSQAFSNMVNSGKLTGDKLRSYMISASKDSGKAWNQYLQTDQGKADMFKATMATTKKSFDTGVSGNLFKSIQQIIGQHKSLAEVQKTVEGLGKSLGQHIGNTIGKVVTFITKNEGPLKTIGSSVWNIVKAISSGAWDTIKSVLSIIGGHSKDAHHGLQGVADSLNNISKHKHGLEMVGKVLISMFAIGKIAKFTRFVSGLGAPIVGITKRVGKLSTVFAKTGKISKTFRFFHPTIFKHLRIVGKGLKSIYSIGKTAFTFLGSKALSVGKNILTLVKSINIAKIATKAWSAVTKVITGVQWAFNAAMDANPIGMITLAIAGVVAGLYELYKHFKPFRKVVNGAFKSAGRAAKWLGGKARAGFNMIKSSMKPVMNFVKKNFKNTFSNVKNTFKSASNSIKDVIRIFRDVLKGNFKDIGKVIPDLVSNMWNTVKGIFSTKFSILKDLTSDALSGISGIFKSWGKSVGNFFSSLWDGIKSGFKSAINWLTGLLKPAISGVNWISSKLGGKTINVDAFHLANGTMDGKLPRNTMAMLNDGNDSPSTQNKELVQLPNGHEFIPQKRNWVGMLPKGSRVFNATQTKMLMELRGIRHYANGSLQKFGFGSWAGGLVHKVSSGVGDVVKGAENIGSKAINGVESAGKSAWNWTKSTAGHLWNGAKKVGWAVMHPIRFIKSLFSGMPKMPEMISNMTGGMINTIKNAALSFFNKNAGSAGNPVGGDTKRWIPVIKKAAAFMHQDLAGGDIGALLNRIQKESGGNPGIRQQVQDVNSAAGNPARGLVQYTPTTFAGWSLPGHGNITNGFDQLLAVMNDSNWRSDIRMPGGWGPTGHRARKNGGDVKANDIYRVNEEGFELFQPKQDGRVINHKDSKNIVNNSNRPIKVEYKPTIQITGNDISEDKILDAINNSSDSLMDKLASKISKDGGYIIG